VRLCVYAIVSESLRFYRRDKIMIFSQHESDIREKGAPQHVCMHVSDAIYASEREHQGSAHMCSCEREDNQHHGVIV
jgi:hypothetical protein